MSMMRPHLSESETEDNMGDVKKRQGDRTSFILGEETDATGSPVTDIRDMVDRLYVATEFTVDTNGDKEQSDSLRAGYSDVFGELARVWGDGNINIELPEAEGLLPILKGLLGDRKPVSTALPNKPLLPVGTHLMKNVVSGANLSGSADKRIIDSMGGIPQAVNLRVTPHAAALISSGTAGTVNITYAVGNTKTTETRSFASGGNGLTTPQDWTLPANATVTRVHCTGFSGGTFDIDAIVEVVSIADLSTGTPATPTNNLSMYPQAMVLLLDLKGASYASNTDGQVTVTYRVNGRSRSVTRTFTNGVATGTETLLLPAGVSEVSSVAYTGFTAGTLEIEAVFPLFDKSFFGNTDPIALPVVQGQTLSGNTAIAIADDLHAYMEALTLKVVPSENAALSQSTGAITVKYTLEGESHTATLNFTSANATAAQTLDLPAGAVMTQVTRSNWNAGTLDIVVDIAANRALGAADAYPGQLHFEMSSALTRGKLTLRGLRKVGIHSGDVLRMSETQLSLSGSAVTSKKYFYQILDINLLDAKGVPIVLGSVALTSRPGGYETVIKMANEELLEYTCEGEVGGIPRLATRMQFIEGSLENGSAVRLRTSVLAKRVDRRRTIENGFIESFEPTYKKYEKATPANPVKAPDGSDVTQNPFPKMPVGFFPNVGGYLEINGEAVIYNEAPISMNHNYDFGDEKAGSLFPPDPERQGRREVTTNIAASYVAGTAEEDKFIRWDEKYLNNEPVHVKIYQFRWASNGRIKVILWTLPYCEITAPVRVEATQPGKIPITIALKGTPDPDSAETAEITVTLINDDREMP